MAKKNKGKKVVTENEFLKRAREEQARRNPIKPEIDKEYVGEFVSLEIKRFEETKGKKKKMRENSILSLADLDTGEVKRYWSFGLLNYFLTSEENGYVKPGDLVFFKKTAKNEKGYYGCEFYSEKKGAK